MNRGSQRGRSETDKKNQTAKEQRGGKSGKRDMKRYMGGKK